jgi:hypothetical protein
MASRDTNSWWKADVRHGALPGGSLTWVSDSSGHCAFFSPKITLAGVGSRCAATACLEWRGCSSYADVSGAAVAQQIVWNLLANAIKFTPPASIPT